jgi:hypothetical protein
MALTNVFGLGLKHIKVNAQNLTFFISLNAAWILYITLSLVIFTKIPFYIHFPYSRPLNITLRILVEKPTQCTNSLIYFAISPYRFRALKQPTIKRRLSIRQDGQEFRSILAHRQSTFKETVTICHIVHVAS